MPSLEHWRIIASRDFHSRGAAVVSHVPGDVQRCGMSAGLWCCLRRVFGMISKKRGEKRTGYQSSWSNERRMTDAKDVLLRDLVVCLFQ